MFKHFEVEENVNDSAVACTKVLYRERGNKVLCNLDNSYSVHDMRHEYSGWKSGALLQDLACSVLQQGGKLNAKPSHNFSHFAEQAHSAVVVHKGKYKVVPVLVMRSHKRSTRTAPLIISLCTRYTLSAHPGRFYRRERTPSPSE